MLEHVLSVKIFRMNGFDSPGHTTGQLRRATLERVQTITLSSDHIGNLDYRILVGLREDTLPTRTLNIETEYPERSDPGPFTLGRMRYELVPSVPP